jgi:hypothetical protein
MTISKPSTISLNLLCIFRALFNYFWTSAPQIIVSVFLALGANKELRRYS